MGEATLNIHVDDYTNRVLGVIKETFGLRDKSQALKKFAEMYGDKFVQKEVKDEVVQSVIEESERHIKKYGMKKMSLKELDDLTKV